MYDFSHETRCKAENFLHEHTIVQQSDNVKELGSVVGTVIQANGRLTFKDDLR